VAPFSDEFALFLVELLLPLFSRAHAGSGSVMMLTLCSTTTRTQSSMHPTTGSWQKAPSHSRQWLTSDGHPQACDLRLDCLMAKLHWCAICHNEPGLLDFKTVLVLQLSLHGALATGTPAHKWRLSEI
jgi:hypothetical protein